MKMQIKYHFLYFLIPGIVPGIATGISVIKFLLVLLFIRS